jgi:nucleotide-binding universal stress UspA family protein
VITVPAASETTIGAVSGRPALPASFVVVGLGDGQLYDYEPSLSFAAHEARLRGAALKVVHGCGERPQGIDEGSSERRPGIAPDRLLRNAAGRRLTRITGPGLRVFMTNAAAGGIDALLEEARTAELLVVQRRDLSPLRRIFAGSTSAAVAAQAACPIAIIRSDHRPDHRSGAVVLGIDGRGRAANAVRLAFDEAERRNARLIAIHAWTRMPSGAPYGDLAHTRHDLEWAESVAADALDRELDHAATRWPQVPVERRIVRASPVDALLDASREAELLVVTRHRVSTRGNWALGTKTSALIEQSGCPVIIAPAILDG